ncbi:hypothetical protein [Paractinoplanes bogorensis]|uniref:hypothetical protein n=1 Tax=Paractinoplanes bogorensis TaxID=1610840 RepID=UPI0027E0ECDD|nr:hypothetical protein [Actinoplanes bogorensis]
MRSQPAPPHVVFGKLTDPTGDPVRPWLVLMDDEHAPTVLEASEPHSLVWSSLWPKRPDARIRFDLTSDNAGGSRVRWTLLVTEPMPDPSLLGHLRKRLNVLIHANLRFTFGQ